jgi:hypothetical protein
MMDIERGHLEIQYFLPLNNQKIIMSIYKINNKTNAGTYVLDLDNGEFENMSITPDTYNVPEGVFPDR